MSEPSTPDRIESVLTKIELHLRSIMISCRRMDKNQRDSDYNQRYLELTAERERLYGNIDEAYKSLGEYLDIDRTHESFDDPDSMWILLDERDNMSSRS